MTNLEPMKCSKCGKNIIALSQDEAGCEDKICRRLTNLENKVYDEPLSEIDYVDESFGTFLFGKRD